MTTTTDPAELALNIRKTALRMVHVAKASHIGSCLSAADILAHLYSGWLNVFPDDPEAKLRDRFIMSKGHAAAAIYATLSLRGFFPDEWLDTYCGNGSKLSGHVSHTHVPGVEVSTGSLGHGLPIALGMALTFKRDKLPCRAITLMSDGELNEGSNWEAFLLAPQLKLGNLLAIVDHNKIQSLGRVDEVINLASLPDKLNAFRWRVLEIDGHDHAQLKHALEQARASTEAPTVILAHTIKGKGVSFMEDRLAWHYQSPSDEQYTAALTELEAAR